MGATASLISEDKDGLLFESGNLQDLIQKTELLISNKQLQTTLGQAGYNKVLENYTWEKVVPKYRNAYLKAIENFNEYKKVQPF